ncbi:MAG: alpha/beta hydrolase [bacterium]|nr:alpha/beta hydrolase [bacterium]
MQKLTIKNRQGEKIAVAVEAAESQRGLAFVMHGLGGFKEQPHIQTFARAFKNNGYTVVLFDATNSIAESDGKLEDATLTNYYEDLEDVIGWAGEQSFYEEPFILVGHSLGSMAIALYAEKYPQKVKALAPVSTVVSGELLEQTPDFKKIGQAWQEKGVREWESSSRPGVMKRLNWSHVLDIRKYNLLPQAGKLTMPVLLLVGDQDEVTPLEHQKLLYEKLPGRKELRIVKGAPHTFLAREHLEEVKEIMRRWVEGI